LEPDSDAPDELHGDPPDEVRVVRRKSIIGFALPIIGFSALAVFLIWTGVLGDEPACIIIGAFIVLLPAFLAGCLIRRLRDGPPVITVRIHDGVVRVRESRGGEIHTPFPLEEIDDVYMSRVEEGRFGDDRAIGRIGVVHRGRNYDLIDTYTPSGEVTFEDRERIADFIWGAAGRARLERARQRR